MLSVLGPRADKVAGTQTGRGLGTCCPLTSLFAVVLRLPGADDMPADFGGGWVQVRYLLPGAHPKRQVLYNQNSPVKQLNSHIGCGRVTWEGMRNLMLGGDLPGGISHMLVCKPAWGLNADSMCSWQRVRLT